MTKAFNISSLVIELLVYYHYDRVIDSPYLYFKKNTGTPRNSKML